MLFWTTVYAFLDKRRLSAPCAGLSTSAPTEERLAQRFGGSISIEIEVQGGAGDTQTLRHFGRICLTIYHSGHGHAQCGFRHFARPAAPPPPSPSRHESCSRPLTDQLGFKFGQRRKNPKHQAAVGSRGIDLRPLASHDLQFHPPLVQGLDQCHQVPEIPPEPIELPHHQRILWAQGLETGLQPGTRVMATGGTIFVDAVWSHPRGKECVPLQIEAL